MPVILESPRVMRCSDCGQSWHPSHAAYAAEHPCVDGDDFVARTGYCEDFPCCGHRAGECGDRAEFTSEYWLDLRQSFEDDYEYDAYCEAMDRQGW